MNVQKDFRRMLRSIRADSSATEFIYSEKRWDAAVETFRLRSECEDPMIDGACRDDDPLWIRKYMSGLRSNFYAENYRAGRFPGAAFPVGTAWGVLFRGFTFIGATPSAARQIYADLIAAFAGAEE